MYKIIKLLYKIWDEWSFRDTQQILRVTKAFCWSQNFVPALAQRLIYMYKIDMKITYCGDVSDCSKIYNKWRPLQRLSVATKILYLRLFIINTILSHRDSRLLPKEYYTCIKLQKIEDESVPSKILYQMTNISKAFSDESVPTKILQEMINITKAFCCHKNSIPRVICPYP